MIPRQEIDFINMALDQEIRLDNRSFETFRDIRIKKLRENGQTLVNIGKTSVLSQIYSSLVSPKEDKPGEGSIVFSIDTSNLKPFSDNDELNELKNRLNNILEKALKHTKAMDQSKLCVVTGKLVWKIVISISLINNDGNIYDCAYLACLSSWLSYKIPFLRKDKHSQINLDFKQAKYIHLPILHLPICITTAFIKGKLLIDPSIKEEKVSDGIIITVGNRFNQICYLHSYYAPGVEAVEVSDVLLDARKWIEHISLKLRDFQASTERVYTIYNSIGNIIKHETDRTKIDHLKNDCLSKGFKDGISISAGVHSEDKKMNILKIS